VNSDLQSSTRPVRPELAKLLLSLKAGQKIRIRQTVRINCRRTWNTADIVGIFRSLNYLATGIATDRVPEDEIVVVAVHFTKENGEMSSITLDDSSHVEVCS
jgi:azurin